ncbi:glycosyltransferase family 4 protein [Candidatus Beckwithbacteria bacterium]|nr:glycosyltransferase family 4 protein [Candidatus Beckwithbacteria bacterium]
MILAFLLKLKNKVIIGIDISQIVYQTGVSRYTRELVKNLLRIDKNNQYKLFAGVFRQKEEIEKFLKELDREKLSYQAYIKFFPPQVASLIWNQLHFLPVNNFIGHVDIFHTSDWSQPPFQSGIKITTIHDFTPIIYSDYHDPKIVFNFEHNLKLIEKECEHVICVSKATQKDLLKFTKINKEKTSVIYEGASENFHKIKDQAKIEKIKNKYNISKKYILSVCTLEPRKNLKSVIQAFQALNLSDYQLVLVGKFGWGEDLVKQQNIILTGFVSDQDLPYLYNGAEMFAYPSFYEGFGLPVLEAMQCGLPVITSNLSSLPEIVDDAGILISPKKVAEIAAAMKKILENSKLKKNLQEKSLRRAEQFSFEKMARQTLELYQKMEMLK